jgi:hypothetical protein
MTRRSGQRRKAERIVRSAVRKKAARKVVRRKVARSLSVVPRHKKIQRADRWTWKRGVVFVGMALSKPRSRAIFRAIEASCAELDLKCERSDRQVGSPPVAATIKKLIEDAEYLVFDLSYERPNVYYELGYAHGVAGRPAAHASLAPPQWQQPAKGWFRSAAGPGSNWAGLTAQREMPTSAAICRSVILAPAAITLARSQPIASRNVVRRSSYSIKYTRLTEPRSFNRAST